MWHDWFVALLQASTDDLLKWQGASTVFYGATSALIHLARQVDRRK